MTKPQTKYIQENGVYMFAVSIQEAILDGYRFDFESNEGMPTQYGFHFSCTMILPKESIQEVQAKQIVKPPEERTFVEQEYDGVMRKAGRPKATVKGTK